jgi:hypothetical protein
MVDTCPTRRKMGHDDELDKVIKESGGMLPQNLICPPPVQDH